MDYSIISTNKVNIKLEYRKLQAIKWVVCGDKIRGVAMANIERKMTAFIKESKSFTFFGLFTIK